jgi:hypothetical protein
MSSSTVAQVRTLSQSKGSARLLLLVIASHVNPDTGFAWPSLETLAREVALTRRRVIQLVHLLESLGELTVRRGQGRGHVNFYRVNLPVREKVKSGTPKGEMFEQEKVKSLSPERNKEREKKEDRPFSLSPQNGADAPGEVTISPEVMRKFGIRYNVADWPPPNVHLHGLKKWHSSPLESPQ